ncbi:glycosyltransferase family 1 protein [Pholiota molesta]|nr:glycosyltransferase family 1 protein [Pholiota molesta]
MSLTSQINPSDIQATQSNASIPQKTRATPKDTLTLDVDHPSPSINYAQYVSEGEGLDSIASVSPDGRISIHLDLKNDAPDMRKDHAQDVEEFAVDKTAWKTCPNMNILIMIVGSRGDVQPYVALGKRFLEDGHRVRIATHETFRQFVTDAGLEFFSIGGNPQDLMSYMVKNPGLMPGLASLTNGDILRKRKMLTEMIDGCWHSCHSPCPITGRAFAADAIISNPPAFAHTSQYSDIRDELLKSKATHRSATVAFAHPLVNIATSNAGYRMSNYLSYASADLLTWQGIGDIINTFRTTKLGLKPLSIGTGPGYVDRLKIPWTYCMSPALVPKPGDWKNHIDVVGFYFLDLATSYQPPPDLVAFLEAGPPPVYIGFGSVVVDDPAAMSKIIFDATEQAGVRALVSAGWGGLGGTAVPPHIFMLGNIPHDWLFDHERVAAVVHHGGAGTTAIGLAKGRPTVVVPFFGDQAFWGNMIHKAGAGPKPIHHKQLTVEKLKDALKFAVSPEAKASASNLALKIHEEDGVNKGVEAFYKHLPLLNMRCDLDPSRLAVWWSTTHCLKLSAFAAQTLADAELLSMRSLTLHRPKEYSPQKKTTEFTNGGGAQALFWSLTHETKLAGTISSTIAKADNAFHSSLGIRDAVVALHDGLRSRSNKDKKPEGPPKTKSDAKSKSKQKNTDDSTAPPKSTTLPGASKPGLVETLKQLVHGKKTTELGRLTISIQGSWAMLNSSSGQTKYDRQRLTRIAEGRQAVHLSTDAERAHIIDRFHAEHAETPLRQQLYRSAVAAAGSGSTSLDGEGDNTEGKSLTLGSSTGTVHPISEEPESIDTLNSPRRSVSGQVLETTSQRADGEDETSIFIREMELAIQLSLEEHERGQKRLSTPCLPFCHPRP